MSQDSKSGDDRTIVLGVQVLAILVVFAVPTAVLALALPDYSSWIVIGGTYLLFATAALFAGIGWRDSNYSPRARICTLLILAATILVAPTLRWISGEYWEFTYFLYVVAMRSASLLSPFIIGLILSRVMSRYTTPPDK
ncbi:MAG: hypothetical protein ABFD49_02515 [Armatimonadota bacterium]|nr:hypothetical protein [bacterium]